MNRIFNALGIHGRLQKNFGAVITLAIAGSFIYGLPYFRFDYYDVYLKTYHLTNTQMGTFGTIIGVFGIISYLVGGIVADKVSLRLIISGSLIGTGIGGFIHLFPLNYYELLLLYAFWGISTTFAFWPACVKAIRVLSDKDDQGKAYGFFEGGRNIAEGIVALIAVQFFNYSMANMHDQAVGMRRVIIFYAAMNVIMGIASFFAVKDSYIPMHQKTGFTLEGMKHLITHPAVWLICIVTFCNHIFCLSTYYYVPYLTDVFGLAVGIGATLAAMKRFTGVIGNIGGGYLTDKFGTQNMMLGAYIVMVIGQVAVLLLPVSHKAMYIVIILYLMLLICFHSNYAMAWTMMSEGAIPAEYTGTAAGLICMAGALPETFTTLLAGRVIDTHPGARGFHYFFEFLLLIMVIGTITVIIWRIYLKKTKGNREKLSEDSLDQLKEYV
ncbi:MAG: nitrate/nitrite transporter [Eubacterium sp.]